MCGSASLQCTETRMWKEKERIFMTMKRNVASKTLTWSRKSNSFGTLPSHPLLSSKSFSMVLVYLLGEMMFTQGNDAIPTTHFNRLNIGTVWARVNFFKYLLTDFSLFKCRCWKVFHSPNENRNHCIGNRLMVDQETGIQKRRWNNFSVLSETTRQVSSPCNAVFNCLFEF